MNPPPISISLSNMHVTKSMQVRMLGTGRPFLVEIQNARQFPSDLLIKEIEMKINSLENKFVCPSKVKAFCGTYHAWADLWSR